MSEGKYKTEREKELLKELGLAPKSKEQAPHTPVQERVLSGFEAIVRFMEEQGRLPHAGKGRDIFERILATRLERLRRLDEHSSLLTPIDQYGMLEGDSQEQLAKVREMSVEEMLEELGVEPSESDITVLKHVRPYEERKAAELIASRQRCTDFDRFEPLFENVKQDLSTGLRESRKFELKSEIEEGKFFIVGGQIAYVARKGEVFSTEHNRTDARLRVIFDNGTESGMLMRSLQRALNKDPSGRRITDRRAGPLFSDTLEEGDEPSGTIYVLRSKSDHPYVKEHREFVHKIGVTHTDIRKRVSNAHLQPTFLMAPVDVVATYDLFNLSGKALERIIHVTFRSAQLDIEVKDRFERPVRPQEWFHVPRPVINEAVERIKNGTIGKYVYDPDSMALRLRNQ